MSAGTLSRGLAALLVVWIALLPSAVQGQDTGRIFLTVTLADEALKGVPVMVSAIGGGEVVFQSELLMERTRNIPVNLHTLRPGEYDVRVEGEGIVTEVKRGVHAFPGRDTNLEVIVRPGDGLHVVEYATGGLAREEVAARLQRLERIVAELLPDTTGITGLSAPEGGPCCHVTARDLELGLVRPSTMGRGAPSSFGCRTGPCSDPFQRAAACGRTSTRGGWA